MSVVVRNKAYDIIFQDDKVADPREFTSSALIEREFDVKESFGEARMTDICFDGMSFGYGTITVNQDIHVEAHDHISTVGLYFTLNGSFDVRLRSTNQLVKYDKLHHNIVYNPGDAEAISVYKNSGIEVIGLNFAPEKFVELAANNSHVLDKYVDAVVNHKPVFENNPGKMTQRMVQVIRDIQTCSFKGGIKKLYLQSKGIELLALQSEQLEQAEGRAVKTYKLSPADRLRIEYARELLIKNAQEPLSLHELARMAGINEFKLKNGFKELFDNTVFGYLNDYRLAQAETMLQLDLSLTAIADELGYSSLQHFSHAFRKKFGVSPIKMRKGA